MKKEVEIKILEIDMTSIKTKLMNLGASEIYKGLFQVDWYRPVGIGEGEDPWFLRIREREGKDPEVTWKGLTTFEELTQKGLDVSGLNKDLAREVSEITFPTSTPRQLGMLFLSIGMELYAHQEKVRTSFRFKDWSFDIDEYPDIPPFLEIEGSSIEHVQDAVDLLNIRDHEIWAEGERTLVQKRYDLDWYEMRFGQEKTRS